MSTYVPNARGFAELTVASVEQAAVLAEGIAQRARDYAPVLSGTYRDSIRTERDDHSASVVADVPYAIFVEVGTADTPAFAPLTRAASETRLGS